MSRNIIAMYGDHGIAEAVVRDLIDAGISRERLAVAVDEPARRYRELATLTDKRRERSGGRGAVLGLVVGVVLGLIAALVAAYGFEPGWVLGPDLVSSLVLCAAIGGAAGVILGWLAGAMSRRSVPVPARHPHGDVLRRSGVVVAADVPNRQARRIARMMERHKPIDLDRRAKSWHGHDGWKPLLPPVTAATVLAGREARDERQQDDDLGVQPSHGGRQVGPTWDPAVHDRPLGTQREGELSGNVRQYQQDAPRQERPQRQERPVSRDIPPREHEGAGEGSGDVFASLEPRFRRHFDRNFRDRGESWEAHREAYETGVRLAWDGRNKPFAGFGELENLARMRWEGSDHNDVPFRRVREAVAYGFEEGRLAFA